MTTINSPAYGMQLVLQAANIVDAETGWPSFVGFQPVDPDACVTLFDAPGQSPEVAVGINHPKVQIRIRGSKTDYNGAYGQCLAIRNAILAIPKSSVYPELTSVVEKGDVQSLGRDESSRPEFVMNYQLITTPVSTGYRQ